METTSKTEENSTTPNTDNGGSELENFLDPPEKTSNDDGPAISGEMVVRLFADETVTVTFSKLGLWTPGRLERAMPRIFRECILARQAYGRKLDGLPEQFNSEPEADEK